MRAVGQRVQPGARCEPTKLRLHTQFSVSSKCMLNASFGCSHDGRSLWVAWGCRARLDLGDGQLIDCGYPGMLQAAVHTCPLPQPEDASARADLSVTTEPAFWSGWTR